jgi:hypothetical protein
MELEEDIQYIVDRDFVNNTWTWAGHTWALRFDGKMVYSFAERFVLDLETGEVIEHSQPYKVRPSFAERICPLLGGHAVPQ